MFVLHNEILKCIMPAIASINKHSMLAHAVLMLRIRCSMQINALSPLFVHTNQLTTTARDWDYALFLFKLSDSNIILFSMKIIQMLK